MVSRTEDMHLLFTEHTGLDPVPIDELIHDLEKIMEQRPKKLLERENHGTEHYTVSGREEHGNLYQPPFLFAQRTGGRRSRSHRRRAVEQWVTRLRPRTQWR